MSVFPTKTLLALDGSEEASSAARMAVELAGRMDSELHVVHVGEVAPVYHFPRASSTTPLAPSWSYVKRSDGKEGPMLVCPRGRRTEV